ncbi:hypothetical protein GJAV_G00271270 [Gymnothorax javanicus]|nr:hypothetical protein GJAV_G00271270 [Gymnothorax javanicus]
MASEPLEGFHEVNLTSPTTPDQHGLADQRTPKHTVAATSALYRAFCQPNTLRADQLPTQPVYSSAGHHGNKEPHNGSVPGLDSHTSSSGSTPSATSNRLESEAGEGGAPNSEEGEEILIGLSRLRSPSVMEVREKGYERLKEELAIAQRELKLKDEECERLSQVRDQLGRELEELTASLFEEAHKMVREANVKQATAEKQLKEALGKIDVLQAEVAALKTLVLSTSPTSPNKELTLPPGPMVPFKRGHARNKSTSSAMLGTQPELSITQPIVRDCKEVDTLLFSEFKAWREDPTLDRSCSFLDRVYREDIYPCLTFSKSELASAILEAVERNTLSVEPVGFQPLPVVKASAVECGGPKKCALSGLTKTCKHRIKFGDSSNYYYVSPFCRYRITSVCNFFTYIRYIHQGLVKQQDAEQMFWEVMQLRKEMLLAKLGFYREEVVTEALAVGSIGGPLNRGHWLQRSAEPSGPGPGTMDVLGENEALRQFFEGEDVRGVLEREVVDTSILEQYLSNDIDPSTFMMPESPPYSGSEPCSPPEAPDVADDTVAGSCLNTQAGMSSSCCLGDRGPGPPSRLPPLRRFTSGTTAPIHPGSPSPCRPQYPRPACHRNMQANANLAQANANRAPPDIHHSQDSLHCAGTANANGYIQASAPPVPPVRHHSHSANCVDPANGYIQANSHPPPPDRQHCQNSQQCLGAAISYISANNPPTPPELRHSLNHKRVCPANGYIQASTPSAPPDQHHSQHNLHSVAAANGYVQANAASVYPDLNHPQSLKCVSPVNGYIQANVPLTNQVDGPQSLHCVNPASGYIQASPPTAPPGLQQTSPGHLEPGYYQHCPLTGPQTGPMPPDTRKRRRSESFDGAVDTWADPSRAKGPFMPAECVSAVGDAPSCDSDGQGGAAGQGTYQVLAWEGYQPNNWSSLYNSSYQSLPSPGYHVDTDKGFSYSSTDEAFVCQKKNHFQVTVHIGMAGTPKYVKTPSGPKLIESFYLKVFGVKFDAQSHLITIEQSQSDRTKKPFLPVQVSLPGDKVTKVTLGRLHFSETTANNMRKKGKPNPDQRYFMLVVGLYAMVEKQDFLLAAHVSEKIIVRASNPGQFESDSEPLWQRGQGPEAVVCQGRVGINTETPDEALVVCGNAKIMGTVMHPSDMRAKHNIQEVDSTEQLKRIAQMRIVEYDYKPEFAEKMGIDQVHETGVIAQEVKELLPSAVKEVGDVTCADGEKIDNFLMVDKEQIFMENVGAVKQLCKLTDNLQNRIQELEVWNTRLAKIKSVTGSLRSNVQRKVSRNDSVPQPKKPPPLEPSKEFSSEKRVRWLHHRAFQVCIIMLVATMGLCVIAITTLYMLNLHVDKELPQDNSNDSLLNETATASPPISSTSAAPTLTPDPWPPDVDFCNLLVCEEVPPVNNSHSDDTKERLFEKLKSAKDWKNTTVQSIIIKENQHVIDHRYCLPGNCGRTGSYSYYVPISKFVPVNMRVTVQMNTTELLVILRCRAEESSDCSTVIGLTDDTEYTMSNTQGYIHEWPLPVARLYRSSYHFRTAVAGKADCTTDPHFSGVLFTDYHFHFYRHCD